MLRSPRAACSLPLFAAGMAADPRSSPAATGADSAGCTSTAIVRGFCDTSQAAIANVASASTGTIRTRIGAPAYTLDTLQRLFPKARAGTSIAVIVHVLDKCPLHGAWK